MRNNVFFYWVLGLLAFLPFPSLGFSAPFDFKLSEPFSNLSFELPLYFQMAPDSSSRVFVVEKKGTIRVFLQNSDASASKRFLDISARVNSKGYEEGLLGLAFPPDFKTSKYFFVYYCADVPRRTVLSRFRVLDTDPDKADPTSELRILEIPQPYSNHNGGQIAFGPDSFIYIGLGDGGSAGDPHGHGQNLGSLLGSILRIDVSRASKHTPYDIPSDNPFIGQRGKKPEIYAYGIRNPWRFSFDSKTGKLWLADVGQNRLEEIDLVEKGKNYGWNIMEGSKCFKPANHCNKAGLTMPVHEYDRKLGQSITGGYVYRGKKLPALYGYYIYGDYMSGRIWALDVDGGSSLKSVEIADTDLPISSFGIDEQGEIYVVSFDGKIYRIEAR